tara:strand:+ start:244 stop:813 length:570 start_codon:yes stop_codon:yes gene_type:complete
MVTDKINELIGKAIDNSNLEKKDFLALNNKTISIILKNTSTILYIVSQEEKFKLVEEIDNEPDLVLEGSPIAFINYINNLDTASSIKISGDASLAESFSNITQKIDINWEQIISEYTNDDIAFYSSKIFEFIKSKKEEITESFYRNAKEYFRDETDVVTSKKEINKYIEDVDNLKNKIEVMEVKLRNKK